MSESVCRFQAEVAAVMEVLLKVAVVEITKVFEGRALDCHGCTVDREAQIKENLVCVPDIRAHMESALTNLSDKMVCSVGVQVGETLLSHHQDQCVSTERDKIGLQESRGEEGLSPSETLCKESPEAVDLQCMVDLPCTIFKETGIGREDGLMHEAQWTDALKKPGTIQENGLQESSSHSVVDPESHPFNSVLGSIPSADLSTDSMSQWDLGLMEVSSLPSVEKSPLIEPPHSSKTPAEATELSQASGNSTANAKKVRLQLSQTPFDCKLLRPCSVQLVNLLMLSSVQRVNGSNRKCFSTPKDLRTHQRVHTGRRLCCFKECGNGIWRLQGVLTHGNAYACKICGKKFKRKKILKRHERFHTGEKPYSCRRCKKTFALRKSLRRHERFHTGERPHVCPHCRKGFRLKNNLKAHLRFHTGEKPFTCNLCSKGFRIYKNLEKHRLSHTAPVSFRTLQ
ncbi:Krueppel-related zinc finger protein 1-like [Sinocyclocheilus rhinocerous]|uniref:Krueppel-related zinc finger protein 1-like n=1 Tax=Sinocyclocheilus rhinocerous TaxID=307959 RepID=A0A673LP67_9TELE|nr:PREDICTED: Krueppel-related zinc finger protein 1-like [Sinocyclocheilus rhinocerous]